MNTRSSFLVGAVLLVCWTIATTGCATLVTERSSKQVAVPTTSARQPAAQPAAADRAVAGCSDAAVPSEAGALAVHTSDLRTDVKTSDEFFGPSAAAPNPVQEKEEVVTLTQFSVTMSRAPAAAATNPNVVNGSAYQQIRVLYATDRQSTGRGEFNGRRSGLADPLSYGSLFVSIPPEHQYGQIERQGIFSRWRGSRPDKEMQILTRHPKSAAAFFENIRVALSKGEKSSFIFVHGFNVAFDDAALRTAQIAYDLDYAGVPVFYSWPSEGGVADYVADHENAEWARANFKRFLLEYARTTESAEIYLIAHSMGNRVLTYALKEFFAENPGMKNRFKEIILAAPDVDRGIFCRDLAGSLTANCSQITLYVSAEDRALNLSKRLRNDLVRLGDSTAGVAVIPGIETVDATGLDTSFLKHSYFAENKLVREDIRKIVYEHLRATFRGLHEVIHAPGLVYWRFFVPTR